MDRSKQSLTAIAVFFCKDFPEVVRQARCQKPQFATLTLRILDGFLHSSGKNCVTFWKNDSADIIDSLVAQGYTVTGYMRLIDAQAFVPFDDEVEDAVATAVNKVLLESLCLELSPVKPT
jgi:hypothetical protein